MADPSAALPDAVSPVPEQLDLSISFLPLTPGNHEAHIVSRRHVELHACAVTTLWQPEWAAVPIDAPPTIERRLLERVDRLGQRGAVVEELAREFSQDDRHAHALILFVRVRDIRTLSCFFSPVLDRLWRSTIRA